MINIALTTDSISLLAARSQGRPNYRSVTSTVVDSTNGHQLLGRRTETRQAPPGSGPAVNAPPRAATRALAPISPRPPPAEPRADFGAVPLPLKTSTVSSLAQSTAMTMGAPGECLRALVTPSWTTR